MAITAKVKLTHKDEHGEGDNRLGALRFSPDYGAGRNKEWALATPYFELNMTVRGEVADRFTLYEPVTLTFELDEVDQREHVADKAGDSHLGRVAYEEYCEAVGGKAFNGDPLPTWDEQCERSPKIAEAWSRVGLAVGSLFTTRA